MKQRDERSQRLFHYKCEGYASVEIAELMGISESSVRVIDVLNRQYLKDKLKKEEYDENM